MEQKYYEQYESSGEELTCHRCRIPLEPGKVVLTYMGNDFPVELPKCPECGLLFLPEDLAVGKILQVEKALEDK